MTEGVPETEHTKVRLLRGSSCLGFLTLSLCASLLPWFATITARAFHCDDHLFLLRARELSLCQALVDNFRMYGGLRPLGYVFLAIQFDCLGERPLAHQLLMLGLHLGVSAALYGLLYTVYGRRDLAIAGALIFAVIPWHMQAVVWVTCGHVLVAAILLLSSAVLFVRVQRSLRFRLLQVVGSALLYGAALLCYEQYLSWFVVWPLLAWSAKPFVKLRETLRVSLPNMTTAVVVAIVVTFTSSPTDRQAKPVLAPGHVAKGTAHRIKVAARDHVLMSLTGFRSYHVPVVTEWAKRSPLRLLAVGAGCAAGLVAGISICRMSATVTHRSGGTGACGLVTGGAMTLAPITILALSPGMEMEQRTMYAVSMGIVFGGVAAVTWLEAFVKRRVVFRQCCLVVWGVLFVLLSFCTATRSNEWALAWQRQKQLAAAVNGLLSPMPANSIVIVDAFPSTIGRHAFTYGNEHGLHFLVARALDRNDVDTNSELWMLPSGDMEARGPSGSRAARVGNRPLFLLRFDSQTGDFVEDCLEDYRRRYPERFTIGSG